METKIILYLLPRKLKYKVMEQKLELNQYPSIIIGKLMNISGILLREGNRLLLPFGLNQQQFSILFEIWRVKKVQQKDMVNRLMLEKAHVSKVVKKLQSMELITVNSTDADKRSSWIETTTKGKKLIEECRAVFKDWNYQWFKDYDLEELQDILNGVDKLQKTFVKKYKEN